jgi:hypothetical protein
MFYICGSNLEDGASEDGSNLNQDNVKGIASQEIYKLVNADFSNNVNVIIETGGARLWSKSPIFGEVTNAEIRHDVLQR